MDTFGSFSEENICKDVKLTTKQHNVPRLRMNGASPPLQLTVFMVLIVTNLPSPFVTVSLLTIHVVKL